MNGKKLKVLVFDFIYVETKLKLETNFIGKVRTSCRQKTNIQFLANSHEMLISIAHAAMQHSLHSIGPHQGNIGKIRLQRKFPR